MNRKRQERERRLEEIDEQLKAEVAESEKNRTIEDWSITQHANIVGVCNGKPIRTSRVVFRNGTVVVTASGSDYLLGSPNKDFANRRVLGRMFAVNEPLQAVDVQYQRVAELMEHGE